MEQLHRILRLSTFIGAVLPLASMDTAAAVPTITWHQRTSPTNATFNAITFGNGQFVVVSDRSGWVLTSADGVSWSAHESGLKKQMYGVAYGNGTYAAIGAGGEAMTSPDGATWTPRETGTSANFNSLRFVNGLFVAAGDGGAICTSADAVDWNVHKTASSNYWQDITFAAGKFTAVGYNYRTGEARSGVTTDFELWDIVDTGYGRYLSAVDYIGDRIYSVGYGGVLQTSVDGLNWTPDVDINFRWQFDIAHGNDVFLSVGETGSSSASLDGVEWESFPTGSRESLKAVAFGRDTFVAVGQDGTIFQTDPITASPSGNILLSDAARNQNQFQFRFSGTVGQTYQLQATTDFNTWTTLREVTCDASPMTCTLPDQTASGQFYRVRQ